MSKKITENLFWQSTRRDFLKQSTIVALLTAGLGPLSLIEWSKAQDAGGLAETDFSRAKTNGNDWRIDYQSRLDPINQVPFISTHYIEPKMMMGKDAVIDYYVTDYDHRDYMFDDPSATFTIDYWVNNVKNTIDNVKAGDNSLTLKALTKGEVLFALQATDTKGRKSHRLFHEFLVVDPAEEVIPNDKVYHPNLQKFGIFDDDTHPVETTKGLTDMLKWAGENGYRKVLLPQGSYRIDADSAVLMASGLTLDMNGSTFKSNPNLRDKVTMLEMVDCVDSHVVNGTFEGDLKERDFEKSPKNTEWVNAVHIGRGSKYCSYESIKVIDVVGRGTNTSMAGIGVGSGGLSYTGIRPKKTGDFALGDIDNEGNPVISSVRLSTKDMVDISEFHSSHGFFQMGMYLGYQGNPTGSWVYHAHFYDADRKYLETIEGYMYRRLYPPKQAKYARFTVAPRSEKEDKIQRLMLFDFLMPYNCIFRNVHHENNRCIGMTPSGFTNLLVEGCTFENCGWAAAKCAFDAEDGWDMGQDLMFRNNTFGKNPRNEFVCVSGHNFVIEDNVMAADMRNRYYTVRNNKLKSAAFKFGDRRSSGSPRVYNNTIKGNTQLITKGKFEAQHRQFFIRDNILLGGATAPAPKEGVSVACFYKCKIEGGNIAAKVVRSELKGIKKTGGVFEIYESTVEDSDLTISGTNSQAIIRDSMIKNSTIKNLNSKILLQDNVITNVTFGTASGWIETLEYIFIGNKIITSQEYLIAMNNSFKQILFENNTVTSTNSQFNGIVLKNPQAKKTKALSIAITKSTFHAPGGTAVNISILPQENSVLTVHLSDNQYNGMKEISDNATKSDNVKILR